VPLVEQELHNLPEHLNGKMADAQHFLCPKTPVLSIYPEHYSPDFVAVNTQKDEERFIKHSRSNHFAKFRFSRMIV
jgi:hypothetical protein